MPETKTPLKPNQAIQFYMPLDAAQAATEEEGGGQWIHIMPTGTWKAPWQFFGLKAYEITADHIRQMVEHFQARVLGIDIAVDENHRAGRAPGWIKDLRADEDGLWARVEWTKLGEELVSDKQHRYVSPSWYDAAILPYRDPVTGEEIPWVLEGLALTNKPFFARELPAVAESRENGVLVCTAAQPDSSRTDPSSAAGSRNPIKGDDDMSDPKDTKNEPDPKAPAGSGEEDAVKALAAENAALTTEAAKAKAERDAAVAERDALRAEQTKGELRTQLEAIEVGGKRIAAAHIEAHVEAIADKPEAERTAYIDRLKATLSTGLVEAGERGSSQAGSADERSAEDKDWDAEAGITAEDHSKFG